MSAKVGEIWRYYESNKRPEEGYWTTWKIRNEGSLIRLAKGPSMPKELIIGQTVLFNIVYITGPQWIKIDLLSSAVDTPAQYRGLMLIPDGECICGIKKVQCDYHK